MKEELLWNGRFRLRQREDVFPLGMDSMALADFADVRPGDAVWDLGCGSGALGLLLAGRADGLQYTGLDCSPPACALAEENLARNGLNGRVIAGEIEGIPERAPRGCADLVIANPPYFSAEHGPAGTAARTGCTAAALCGAAGRLLHPGGRFALVYPAQALPELFGCLRGSGLEPKRLRLIAHRPSAAPKRALVGAVRGGRPGLAVLPLLFWYEEDGGFSAEYRRIYHEADEPAAGGTEFP